MVKDIVANLTDVLGKVHFSSMSYSKTARNAILMRCHRYSHGSIAKYNVS